MTRSTIIAGKAVILVSLEDNIGKGLTKVQNQVSRLSNSLNKMGGTALRGGFLGALASGKIAKDFMSYEDSILFLSTKLESFNTDMKKNGEETLALSEKIKTLSRSMGELPLEVSKAAISLASANFSPKAIEASLQGVINLSRGTDYGLADSAKLIANLSASFKLLGADQSAAQQIDIVNKLVSQLVKATNLGTIEIEDLRESLKYAGGTAAELGIKLPVILGFLAELGDSSLKASLGGTSLNIVMLRMATNLDKIKAVLPGFNLTTDGNGNVDLVSSMSDLYKATEKFSNVKKIDFFNDIFNIRGARAVLGAKNIENIENHIEKLNKVTDLAVKAQQQMNSGVGGVWRRLTTEASLLNIEIGEKLNKEFKVMGEVVTVTVHALGSLAIKFKAITLAILLAPFALGAFAIGAYTLSFALSRLTGVLSLLKSGLKGISSIAKFSIGSATNTLSMLTTPSKSSLAHKAAIEKETKLITKLKAKQALSLAKGSSPAKVAASKNTANLIAAEARLATLKPKGNFGNNLRAGGTKILGMGDRIEAIYKEKKEIKAQIALEKEAGIAAKAKYNKNIALNKNVDGNLKNRAALASKLETAANKQKKRITNLENLIVTNQEAANIKRNASLGREASFEANHLKNTTRLTHLRQTEAIRGVARELEIQKQYDALYKVRNELATQPKFIKPSGGGSLVASQNYEILKTREKELASLINSRQAKTRAIAFEINKLEAATTKPNFKSEQSRILLANKKETLSIERLIVKNKIALEAIEAKLMRGAKQAGFAEKMNATATAERTKIAINFEKTSLVRSARIARAGKALQGTSYFTGMGKGIASLFKGFSVDKTLIGITRLGFSFLKLSGSLLRFAFSWNAVGMIFNVLLLFGDKIPVIANAFTALGQGFKAAFGELGKIAAYTAPAFKLLQLSFNAFSKGNSAKGMEALGAAVSGVADIISNQLSAAWDMFMSKVEYIVVFFKQIGKTIWTTLSGVFDGLTLVLTNLFSGLGTLLNPLSDSMSKVSTGSLGLDIGLALSEGVKVLIDWGLWLVHALNEVFVRMAQMLYPIIKWMDPLGANDVKNEARILKLQSDSDYFLGKKDNANKRDERNAKLTSSFDTEKNLPKLQEDNAEKYKKDLLEVTRLRRNIDLNVDITKKRRLEQTLKDYIKIADEEKNVRESHINDILSSKNSREVAAQWRNIDSKIAAGRMEKAARDFKDKVAEAAKAQQPDAPTDKKKEEISANFGQVLSALVGSIESTRGEYFKTSSELALDVAKDQRQLLKDIKDGIGNLEAGVG